MPGDSSFALGDLFKPGDAHKHVLMRQLSVLSAREHAPYLYKGEASYFMAHGTYFPGRALPDEYDDLVGPMTECHVNSLLAAEARPELRYFTGFYLVGRAVGPHSWLIAPDGGVLEVTYPSKNMPPGTVTASHVDGPSVPYLGPEHWAYFGLEFDTTFIRSLFPFLPVLDPVSPYLTAGLSHPYSPRGWPIT